MSARGLRFEGVAVRLGDREVLRDVSFSVHPGEVVALLGRNGAGKTTLLRIATRVTRPDRGGVWLGEHALEDLPRRDVARQLATVPQSVEVPFPFLAGELVLMGRTPHQSWMGFESEADLERARSAMTRVGIAELANRAIGSLSGGERQLVLFARALAQEPQWLLLDEPTAFLDLRHRIDVLRAVRAFAASGGGALVVSHDLALAARICDRLVVLDDGEVIADGPPAEVVTRGVLQKAFGIDAYVLKAPDGAPVVVPRIED
jgi:iron complex transport system ATP-binding protein